MALETAVVANDIPILREVVGDAGRFVDATDTERFAAAIGELVDDPDERQELAARASVRVETRFSLERTVAAYVDLYRDVIANSHRENTDERIQDVRGQ
jgi:glycosyltransferase involved in cell wall biosynthesis